jgi:hypothetical protein
MDTISSHDRMRVICLVESIVGSGVSDDEAAIFKMHSKCCKIYSEHMKTAAGMMSVIDGEIDSSEKTNADRLAMNAVKKYLVGKKIRAQQAMLSSAASSAAAPAMQLSKSVADAKQEKVQNAFEQNEANDIDLFITKQLRAHKAARISMKP